MQLTCPNADISHLPLLVNYREGHKDFVHTMLSTCRQLH
jgi:hypothetical protein